MIRESLQLLKLSSKFYKLVISYLPNLLILATQTETIQTMTNSIQLLICDMAGTTVQDKKEVETCFARACVLGELEVSEERILALQGYSKRQVFEMLWTEKLGKNHTDFAQRVDISYNYFRQILEEHYETHAIFPTEGCLELFDWLKSKGIKIALTTGFYRKVTNIILGKLGWLKGLDEHYLSQGNSLIDVSIASDEVPKGRPEPYMIQRAMMLLQVQDPFRVVNIGDTPSDLESGIRAGCRLSLGVTNGTHTHAQLAIFRNDGLLDNILEIKSLLDS